MENVKVIDKMSVFDWGVMFIPPIVSVAAVPISQRNKLAYRIVMAICSFPIIFFAVEYLLIFAMNFGGQTNANLP